MTDVRSTSTTPVDSDFASGKGTPLVVDQSTGYCYVMKSDDSTVNIVTGGIGSYTDADTTPTVAGVKHLTLTNSGGTSITAFDDGVDGQEVTLLFTDGNTTLVDAAGLQLAGSANFTGTANDILTIVKRGSVWYEKSRSAN